MPRHGGRIRVEVVIGQFSDASKHNHVVRGAMESTIEIRWSGDPGKIKRAIQSIEPDDPDAFTVVFVHDESSIEAIITVKASSLSTAKATADDILACLGAATVAGDVLES